MEKYQFEFLFKVGQMDRVADGFDQVSSQHDVEVGKVPADSVQFFFFKPENVYRVVRSYFYVNFAHSGCVLKLGQPFAGLILVFFEAVSASLIGGSAMRSVRLASPWCAKVRNSAMFGILPLLLLFGKTLSRPQIGDFCFVFKKT